MVVACDRARLIPHGNTLGDRNADISFPIEDILNYIVHAYAIEYLAECL